MAGPQVEGHVLSIEEQDLIVDLAVKDGFLSGDEVELWRPLKLRHPVTGKVVIDRYRIGTLRLTQVRPSIALARLDGAPLRPPLAGDLVVGTSRVTAPSAPVATARMPADPSAAPGVQPSVPEATTPLPVPGSDEDRTVAALFDSLRGASLAARIEQYERYAASRPDARHSGTLLEEAAALRELVKIRVGEGGPGAGATSATRPALEHFVAPARTIEGTPLRLALEVRGSAAGAVLHLRSPGDVAYQPLPMEPSGARYFSVTIPAGRVRAPGIEYFIEGVGSTGSSVELAGTAQRPLRTRVSPVPRPTPPLTHENAVGVVTDFADYNRLRGNDRVFQTEGTFSMRFSDVGVRALRSGFGVYRGVGGSLEELDEQKLDGRAVGLTYGHIEGEFGVTPAASVIARLVLGLGDDGTDGGGQLHVRIGSDKSTNLSVGGEVLGGIGVRGITQLELEPRGRFPILIRSEVSNQPAGASSNDGFEPPPTNARSTQAAGDGDIGVRAIVQLGYRIAPPLVVALRGSYQGRTINHAGPGAGGAVEYRW